MRPRDSTARGRPLCMRGTGRGMRDEGGGPGLRGGGGGRAEPPRLAVGPSFLPSSLSLPWRRSRVTSVSGCGPRAAGCLPAHPCCPGRPPPRPRPLGEPQRGSTPQPQLDLPSLTSTAPSRAGQDGGTLPAPYSPPPLLQGPLQGQPPPGMASSGGASSGGPPLGRPPLGGGLQSESSRGAHLAAAALPQRPRLLPLPLPVREDAGASLRAERGRGEGALHRWTASSSVLVHGFSPSAGSGRNLFQDAHFFGIVPASRPQMRFSLT